MYSFEEFKKLTVFWMKDVLSSIYGDIELSVEMVKKTNCELTGVRCDVLDGTRRISPVFYLEPWYEKYLENENFTDCLSKMKDSVVDAIDERNVLENMLGNYDDVQENIVFHFIHTAQNREMLETMPHREFQDLSIVYRWIVGIDDSGIASAPINNGLARLLKLNEQELYDLAYENTKRIFRPVVKPMKDVAIRMLINERKLVDLNEISDVFEEVNPPFYVVSNHMLERGAASILYTDELQKLAESLNSDLYLVPNSVHEMIAVPVNAAEPERLEDILYEINQMALVEERLSNEIYKYDQATQSIIQVTDSEHKMVVDESDEGLGMEMC